MNAFLPSKAPSSPPNAQGAANASLTSLELGFQLWLSRLPPLSGG